MAFVLNDRVKETSTTTGTGTLDLGGAATGFETFVAGIGTTNVTYYAISHATEDEWEVGYGTVTDASTDTLSRTAITSSNSDSLVSFSAGTKSVFCTMPSKKIAYLDSNNNFIIGTDTSGVDYNLTFRGEDNDGVLTWMEDEDYFKFGDDVLMNSSEKLYFYDAGGEYVSGDGTDLTITSGAKINLTATSDVVIPANVGITFGTGEKIEGDSTDLTITSGAKINLTATSDVHIPNDVGIVFGGASEKIEGDGTDMTISSNNLTVDAAADITLDAGGADILLKDDGTTYGTLTNNSSELIIKSGTTTAATFAGANVTFAGTVQGTTITATTAVVPDASDGAALGTTALEWSDLFLADGAVIQFGDDQDVSLTHVADAGLLLSSTDQLQFGDSGTYIYQSTDGQLDLVADTEIQIAATTIDINGAADISGNLDVGGTLGITGVATFATHVALGDSDQLKLGASTDMQIYHDGTNSYVANKTGALKIATETSGIAVTIGHTTSETTVADNLTVTGNLTVSGTQTIVDTVTMQAQNAIIFEGATADNYETTLSIVDPTADHTQYLINQDGYIPVLAAATTTAISSTPAELNILDGVTSTAAELNLVDGSSAGTIVNSKGVIYGSSGEVNATTLQIAGTSLTATAAELNYVDGVTSAIQTQMDTKTTPGFSLAMAVAL